MGRFLIKKGNVKKKELEYIKITSQLNAILKDIWKTSLDFDSRIKLNNSLKLETILQSNNLSQIKDEIFQSRGKPQFGMKTV